MAVPQYTSIYPYGQVQTPQVPSTPQSSNQPSSNVSIHMGKVVSDPREISAQDVTMDGSLTLFPDANGQVIYGRAWMPNGGIAETRFVSEQKDSTQNQDDPFVAIMNQLTDMKDDLDDLKKAVNRRKPYHKQTYRNNQNESGEVNA